MEKSNGFVSVVDAVLNGTALDQAIQSRLRVAAVIDDETTSARDLAALTNRLSSLTREIEERELIQQNEAEDSVVTADEEFDADSI